MQQFFFFFWFVCFCFCFCLIRAAPMVCGSSQARGLNRSCSYWPMPVTTIWDPSRICYLHHSSWQRWILNPLSKARDWTHVLMDTSWIHYHWTTMGTPNRKFFFLTFCFLGPYPRHIESSQARSRIRAAAAGLYHSHNNVGSKLHLWPVYQLTAVPDPWPTEWGQGSNPHPHGY